MDDCIFQNIMQKHTHIHTHCRQHDCTPPIFKYKNMKKMKKMKEKKGGGTTSYPFPQ